MCNSLVPCENWSQRKTIYCWFASANVSGSFLFVANFWAGVKSTALKLRYSGMCVCVCVSMCVCTSVLSVGVKQKRSISSSTRRKVNTLTWTPLTPSCFQCSILSSSPLPSSFLFIASCIAFTNASMSAHQKTMETWMEKRSNWISQKMIRIMKSYNNDGSIPMVPICRWPVKNFCWCCC